MGKMARNDYTPTGRIDNMVKDLDAVLSLARQTGTAMPMTSLCMDIHRLLVSAGFGAADNAALMRFYDGPRV
jgi:2-hydroxy-3-oxopropionate reductase